MKIVITGGHHTSALPVIKKLKELDPDIKILWYGHKYTLLGDTNVSLEYKDILDLHIPFFELHAGKFYKTYNLKRLLKIPYGFVQALQLLLKHKPDVILSFGGYLAVPVVIIGYLLKIPSLTHEQTLVVGWANSVIARFVDKILISWEDSLNYFPKHKTLLSGLPMREELFSIVTDRFKVNQKLPTLYVTAGKTGSLIINEAIKQNLQELLGFVNIIHQCGDYSKLNYFEILSQEYTSIKDKVPGRYFLERFVSKENVGEAYNKSDYVLSRAGAHTVLERLVLNKPGIIVPIPWVSHNEQNINAQYLKKFTTCEILQESELNSALVSSLKKIQQELLKSKKYPIFDSYKKDAAKIIAHETLELAKKV
ncbi:glycosyltransferase [candidate division WWE3 bacterium]|uniref:Glycosyltransferase n=1 Tax=candidate division WWE3 bacterium TaxID=2053526 RepID=A0A955J1P4_UNCKA|nr:glycosyltransferase [candidate division WWE3 bacterium]